MLLFSDVFVPELLAAKERVADDVRRGGVERRERARGIELGFQVVEDVEEFFAQAALGFKGIVIRGFGSFCGRCCRDFVFVFFSVFFVIFLDFFGDDGKARRRRRRRRLSPSRRPKGFRVVEYHGLRRDIPTTFPDDFGEKGRGGGPPSHAEMSRKRPRRICRRQSRRRLFPFFPPPRRGSRRQSRRGKAARKQHGALHQSVQTI
mmetsp:Transcript_5401/g.15829  ORF Transcript_5401/g.15829 Transcript_5401/m.15829 type:complete len:205 (-) Transcript_5401:38-652(-)